MDINYHLSPITHQQKLPSDKTVNHRTLPLSPQGAEVILGNIIEPEQLVIPVAPSSTTMFGPRAACLLSESGPLWVSDPGHHRLLVWQKLPTRDRQPADWVIGQP
ncbi:hypothetical protein LC574_37520, partial [Nostoc sp. CHAB 5715]|nr:hypothetical protein [Nostoc sp. CHAB 5715]